LILKQKGGLADYLAESSAFSPGEIDPSSKIGHEASGPRKPLLPYHPSESIIDPNIRSSLRQIVIKPAASEKEGRETLSPFSTPDPLGNRKPDGEV